MAALSGAAQSNTWEPAWLKDMTAWIKDPNISMYGRWLDYARARLEGGVDLTAPPGTPVYALADGPLLGAGNFGKGGPLYSGPWATPDYGVVSQRITVPGYGVQDIYYQHIIIDPSIKFCNNPTGDCQGQTIAKGQKIGVVGPFGETEVGFNADWGGVWGTNHPGSWVTDPRPLIKALMEGGTPSGTGQAAGSPPIGNSGNPLDILASLPNLVAWINDPVRIIKIAVGLLLIGGAVFLLVAPSATKAAVQVAKVAA